MITRRTKNILLWLLILIFLGGGGGLIWWRNQEKAADLGIRTSNEFISPKSHAADFSYRVEADGRLIVTSGGMEHVIDSSFSYPGENSWNTLGTRIQPEGGWTITRSGNTVTAQGGYYKIVRTLAKEGGKLTIRDTFTSLSSEAVGIRLRYDYQYGDPAADVYMVGQNDLEKNLPYRFTTYGNPSVFVGKSGRGMGILVRDDNLRVNGNAYNSSTSNLVRINNDWFGLKPGTSYTTELAMYPINTADYYDFINLARVDEGSNYKVDNFEFLPVKNSYVRWLQMTDAEFKTHLQQMNVKYIGTYNLQRSSAPDYPSHGTSYFSETKDTGEQSWDLTRQLIEKVDRTGLDVKVILYLSPFVNNESGILTKYPDSVFLGESLQAQAYSPNYPEDLMMAPTEANSYGRKLLELVPFLKAKGFDGLYIDTYRYGNSSSLISYDDALITSFDDHTFKINTSNNQVERDVNSTILSSSSFMKAFTEATLAGNGVAVANLPPGTAETSGFKIPYFTESNSFTHVEWMHLSSPVGLAAPRIGGDPVFAVTSPEEDIRNMRQHLDHGLLHYPYGYRPTWEGNPYQTIYPITPKEIHSGYIIGEDRIVTTQPGKFGWNDRSASKMYIYNGGGHLVSNSAPNYIERDGLIFADVALPQDYMAVLVKDGVVPPSTISTPAPPAATPTARVTATPLATIQPTATPTATATPRLSATPSARPTSTPSSRPGATATPSVAPSSTPSASPTASVTPSATPPATPTPIASVGGSVQINDEVVIAKKDPVQVNTQIVSVKGISTAPVVEVRVVDHKKAAPVQVVPGNDHTWQADLSLADLESGKYTVAVAYKDATGGTVAEDTHVLIDYGSVGGKGTPDDPTKQRVIELVLALALVVYTVVLISLRRWILPKR